MQALHPRYNERERERETEGGEETSPERRTRPESHSESIFSPNKFVEINVDDFVHQISRQNVKLLLPMLGADDLLAWTNSIDTQNSRFVTSIAL